MLGSCRCCPCGIAPTHGEVGRLALPERARSQRRHGSASNLSEPCVVGYLRQGHHLNSCTSPCVGGRPRFRGECPHRSLRAHSARFLWAAGRDSALVIYFLGAVFRRGTCGSRRLSSPSDFLRLTCPADLCMCVWRALGGDPSKQCRPGGFSTQGGFSRRRQITLTNAPVCIRFSARSHRRPRFRYRAKGCHSRLREDMRRAMRGL